MDDLYATFSRFGNVEDIKLHRDQCYAFVHFDSKKTAQAALASCGEAPIVLAGHELRVNQAYGTNPDWSVGFSLSPSPPSPYSFPTRSLLLSAQSPGEGFAR